MISLGYNMKSGLYSTWTESIWQTLSVRMFLKPSIATERFSMILGSLIASASIVLVWFINNRADVLFNSRFVYNIIHTLCMRVNRMLILKI